MCVVKMCSDFYKKKININFTIFRSYQLLQKFIANLLIFLREKIGYSLSGFQTVHFWQYYKKYKPIFIFNWYSRVHLNAYRWQAMSLKSFKVFLFFELKHSFIDIQQNKSIEQTKCNSKEILQVVFILFHSVLSNRRIQRFLLSNRI